VFQNALRANEDFIVRNMQRGRAEIIVEYSPNKGPIGRTVARGSQYVEDAYDVRIVIVKDRNDGLYRIITAYPINK